MMRRARVLLVAAAVILLAIPLLPGPGVFIIMAALADVHDAFHGPSARPSTAGFPPAAGAAADAAPSKQLSAHHLTSGRRVA